MGFVRHVALGAILFAGLVTTASAQSTYEVNIDRPGLDYRQFALPRGGPRACQRACLDADRCAAWTYVRPGYQGAEPRCWLKYAAPASRPSECCISGVVQ